MTKPSFATRGEVTRCANCGSELAVGALSCPVCGTLVHAAELKQLAALASQMEAVGDYSGATENWRRVLAMLPAHAEQRTAVDARVAELTARLDSTPAAQMNEPKDARPWWKRGAAAIVAAVVFALGKLKFLLLGLTKMTTLLSMLAFFGVYWSTWGWKIALGFVISIYIHEMGHVFQLRKYGIDATAPMFIPGLGAFIRSKQHYRDPHMDAKIGLAGPLWGLGAGLVAYAVYWYTSEPYWGAIAHITGYINLFNLLPVWQLDGSRGFHGLNRWMRWSVAAAFFAAFFLTGQGLLIAIGAVAVFRAFQPAVTEPDYDAFGTFLVLIAALSWLSIINVPIGAN